MYATCLPPRPNPRARINENYAPRFSREELPLIPVKWNPSWRTPPSKLWGVSDIRPKTTGSVRFSRDSAARQMWGSHRENCIRRLHATPTHNISDRSIDLGLIPQYVLDGDVPPCEGKRASSLDYFPSCEKPPVVPPIRMGHQFSTIREPPADRLEAYKGGKILQDSPVRVVRHTSKDRTFLKKSALRNARGVSRNVLGGFCTS